jgi:hypothetical protein
VDARRKPEELSEEERQELHRAHQRLRNASHALEALTVVAPVRGRWVAKPAPADALQAAAHELHEAAEAVWSAQQQLLGWGPPIGTANGTTS